MSDKFFELKALALKPLSILVGGFFAWFSVEHIPSPMMLFWLGLTMVINLCTGVAKSWKNDEFTTHEGFQKSAIKIVVYTCVVVAVVVLVNMVQSISGYTKFDFGIAIDGTLGFLVWIELYSVFENVSIIYPASPLTRYFILPILKVLRSRLKNGPFETDKTDDNASDQHN